jgi:hypothetical protein
LTLRLDAAAIVVSTLTVVTSCILTPGQRVGPAVAGEHYFGTLVSQPSRATTEARGGVTIAMVELSWRSYEPQRGQWSTSYGEEIRARIKTFIDAGQRITLGLGLHDPPSWVHEFPSSRFVDQNGSISRDVNLVFNDRLRHEAERYFDHLRADLNLADIWAIRLTSGGSAEVLYPSRTYAAFDANAQNGVDLPPSMPRNPYPGWRPGDRSLTTDQVTQWADWYVGALANVVDWQISKFDGLGFRGYYQVLTPGSGARPSEYRKAIQAYLPDGIVGIGAVWDRFYQILPTKRRVVAYVSSMADGSGNNDSCRSDDRSVPLDSAAADPWSATRWISRIADEYGLAKAGENPGWGDAPEQFYRDTSGRGLMASSIRQMVDCKFSTFYWAHDQQLWDGTIAFEPYAANIDRVTGGHNPAPPPAS